MDKTLCIFFVSETEYPKLQASCPDDFPFTYKQFVERVEEGIKEMSDVVSATFKVNVSVAEFLAWCAESNINPDNRARSKYAMFMHSKSINPNAHL